MTITGECFCGEVTYRVEGKLRNARSCHCSRCRKVFSGQASAYAEVNASDFYWLSGEQQLQSYIGKQGYGYQFCQKCGSVLCGVHHEVGQGVRVHGVTLGCVNGDPGVVIDMHIYVDSKAPWEVIPDGVVSFAGAPPSTGNLE